MISEEEVIDNLLWKKKKNNENWVDEIYPVFREM